MRSHGVPSFPDPNSNGIFPPAEVQSLKTSLESSPQAKAAYAACKPDLPSAKSPVSISDAKMTVVRFAQCMRSHGVPNFPDPGSGPTTTSAASLDASSPRFKKAALACQKLLTPLAGKGS